VAAIDIKKHLYSPAQAEKKASKTFFAPAREALKVAVSDLYLVRDIYRCGTVPDSHRIPAHNLLIVLWYHKT